MTSDTAAGAGGQGAAEAAPPGPRGPVEPDNSGTNKRRRARPRLGGVGRSSPRELDELFRTLRGYDAKVDRQLIVRAYERAAAAHAGQHRASGEPYMSHPLAVAVILADFKMDSASLAAALLHDTVEDTDYTLDRLRDEFGDEIARLVDGVTKLDRVTYGDSTAAGTLQKMITATARDVRVLVIKLADRLHNMRTLKFIPRDRQEAKARETMEIYAPLAYRLGMNGVKRELEDLAFATIHPVMYDLLVHLVAQRAPSRDKALEEIMEIIRRDLKSAKIKATVIGRPKHYYSIYQKMEIRGRDFADIYDLIGVRILVESVRDCYAALGLVHARLRPVQGRFKDYIGLPRSTSYRSLHTTVMGPGGKQVELQIRTEEMDQEAEFGPAAHWRYKHRHDGKPDPGDLEWLRPLLEWKRETGTPEEFLDTLRFGVGQKDEIFTFTPKSGVISLPLGSTPVDFAYAVHTAVGHKCVGALVEGTLVPLDSVLHDGQRVEILVSDAENAGPSRDWLAFVKTPRARNKIRSWFSKERRDEAIEAGQKLLANEMRRRKLPMQRIIASDAMGSVIESLRYQDISALYADIGESRVSPGTVVGKLIDGLAAQEVVADDLADDAVPASANARTRPSPGVAVKGGADGWVRLARCCTPLPGDEIIGFATHSRGVSVHRAECRNVPGLRKDQPGQVVDVEWEPASSGVFLVNIRVEALDRVRLLTDVTSALSDEHVNILAASVETKNDRRAISRFSFELAEPKHLGALLRTVREVEGVYDAYRV